ncbi:MAG: hypothetical protein GF331_13835 [Chitinivibrionales bacterium]|nr:hypothetical protein [Chitinivibrionales bacterium]
MAHTQESRHDSPDSGKQTKKALSRREALKRMSVGASVAAAATLAGCRGPTKPCTYYYSCYYYYSNFYSSCGYYYYSSYC